MSEGDVSFDGRASRFVERIYGSSKGELRLEAAWQQLQAALPALPALTGAAGAAVSGPLGPGPTGPDPTAAGPSVLGPSAASQQRPLLRCWDAGGGAGQMTLRLAQQGHQVLLNDLSGEMLALAETALAEAGLKERVTLRQEPIRAVTAGPFDLIVCHAVLEWVVDQQALIAALARRLAPGGLLSLMFYNRDALILTHVIRGNVERLLHGDLVGHPGGLTPPNAAAPAAVAAWLAGQGLVTVARHGIRSLSDFLPKALRPTLAPAVLRELDARYGEQPPFSELARYQHWLCRAAG